MHANEIPLTSFSTTKGKPSLPSNFAMTILEKEIELEKSWAPAIISDLVELYSQAIEFYNFNNDSKYNDYCDRMHKMLTKPKVVSALSTPNSRHTRMKSEQSVTDHKQELEKSRKLMSAELNSSLSVTTHKTERSITRVLTAHETTTRELTAKLGDDFKKQDGGLLDRLENRRKMNKTFQQNESIIVEDPLNLSYSNPMEVVESDRSGGFAMSKEEMNKKIEEVMERHFAEKAAKIAEVNVKYEKEILEMQDDGVMALVISQMRQNMKEEIESISKEFDLKRRAEILMIKQGLS